MNPTRIFLLVSSFIVAALNPGCPGPTGTPDSGSANADAGPGFECSTTMVTCDVDGDTFYWDQWRICETDQSDRCWFEFQGVEYECASCGECDAAEAELRAQLCRRPVPTGSRTDS
jgi:hypothetical protein